LWLTNNRAVMGEDRNGVATNMFASLGCLLLIAISYYMVVEKIPASLGYRSKAEIHIEQKPSGDNKPGALTQASNYDD
ncbi:MAG: hypothetical protein MK103_09615, partial [Planctomycetes bacterium]|nr:hypothetical protein [Planctomycetota bacterium]